MKPNLPLRFEELRATHRSLTALMKQYPTETEEFRALDEARRLVEIAVYTRYGDLALGMFMAEIGEDR